MDCEHCGSCGSVDEFGRAVKHTPKSRWPPVFETHGSDYTLNSGTGLFYEDRTKFWYDPKRRWYWNASDGTATTTYFRYNAKTRKFTAVPAVESAASMTPQSHTEVVPKQTIAIKLKTKKLPKKAKATLPQKPKPITQEMHQPSKISKEHAENLDTWSRQQKVPRTAAGEPICTLCRRKFATLEKLYYHERVSQLHQTNLAKQKTPPKYFDRAEQRRALHCDFGANSSVATSATSSSTVAAPPLASTTTTPVPSGIGEQMLQKMGWSKQSSAVNVPLQKDWERIESLAAEHGKGKKQKSGEHGGVGL